LDDIENDEVEENMKNEKYIGIIESYKPISNDSNNL